MYFRESSIGGISVLKEELVRLFGKEMDFNCVARVRLAATFILAYTFQQGLGVKYEIIVLSGFSLVSLKIVHSPERSYGYGASFDIMEIYELLAFFCDIRKAF